MKIVVIAEDVTGPDGSPWPVGYTQDFEEDDEIAQSYIDSGFAVRVSGARGQARAAEVHERNEERKDSGEET